MLRILKLIYRFDFEPSFEMIDQPGSVMRVLSDTRAGYWADIGDNRGTRLILGEHRGQDQAYYASIRFEPTTLSGHFEHGEGLAFDSPQIGEFLDAVGFSSQQVFDKFRIRDFARAGARFQAISGTTNSPLDPSEAMRALIPSSGVKSSSRFVRETKDFNITIEGTMESEISFKITTGPGALSDYDRFLGGGRTKPAPPTPPTRHELAADIDLFERSIHIPSGRIQRWIAGKYDIAEQLLPDLRAMILRK